MLAKVMIPELAKLESNCQRRVRPQTQIQVIQISLPWPTRVGEYLEGTWTGNRISFLCCGRGQSGGMRLLASVVYSPVGGPGDLAGIRVSRVAGRQSNCIPVTAGNGTICRKET